MDVAKKVYRPDIYQQAAQALVEDGVLSEKDFPDFDQEDGFRAPQTHFIDNIVYDGRTPNDYLKQFSIGLKGKDKV
jgi:nitrate/nitrite transport system substrate-binding protein